jgi:hypothetical protein
MIPCIERKLQQGNSLRVQSQLYKLSEDIYTKMPNFKLGFMIAFANI